MPRRDDIKKILLIGSGPIVIGQACEFDYSGTQGAKTLKAEGYEVILVNSNPATIMTDPGMADRTYVEPLTPRVLEAILEKERPQAILPTLGGQTALNLALAMHDNGVLDRLGIELLGANVTAIRKAEERDLFKQAMEKIGLECARAHTCRTLDEAKRAAADIGFPIILRPSLTMGGSGGGIVERPEDFDAAMAWAFSQSPIHECLVEESVVGWKEFELEVIRDKADNFAVICTIENFDPMGVHTGDSITVAPAMTLTDREYQRMRDAGKKIITEIGVDTGGANIQFAVCPNTGRLLVIEMNPRVSRSSALASKATGYPIAKVAARLAVGYTLDELSNELTGTSAAFEPTIDYVVVKIPRFAFEKFRGADPRLTTQMKSVGESMAIGRTFREALQKAARSLEVGRDGVTSLLDRVDYRDVQKQVAALLDVARNSQGEWRETPELIRPLELIEDKTAATQAELKAALLKILRIPLADRLWFLGDAFRVGASEAEIHEVTKIDPWFLREVSLLIAEEAALAAAPELSAEALRTAKAHGFTDNQIARLRRVTPATIRDERRKHQIERTFIRVDTCAGEFEARTPYLYSTWGSENEALPQSSKKKVMILGGGPNRIGQGIEFDYCCVHAAMAFRDLGWQTIMVNCNPETVSTDYDTSDRLYFEPLTFEDVLAIAQLEKPDGVIVQYGGQTPLKLARALTEAGVPILGTSAEAIDRAEDRERFDAILTKLDLRRPRGGIAKGMDEAFHIAAEIGFPAVVRPSYVLGGRAMEIVHSEGELREYFAKALMAAVDAESATILVDEFLQDAIEVDVDAVCDGKRVVIGGVMQHIEEAGVHSGDSSMVLPAHALPPEVLAGIRSATRSLAMELGVVGLVNVQFAVRGGRIYVIEVNPRASRTVPFIGKATGVPLAQIAAKVMSGMSLEEVGFLREPVPRHVAVKESVFPFHKFPGVDILLGPEMRSTGEVMGVGETFPEAFLKALWGTGAQLPTSGKIFISVKDADKLAVTDLAYRLALLGFDVVATGGTASTFARASIETHRINKVREGSPHVVDMLRAKDIQMVINTTEGAAAIRDSRSLRRETLAAQIPYFTTIAAASAAVAAMEAMSEPLHVKSLQEYHDTMRRG